MRKLFKENLTTLFSFHCTRVPSKESRILAAMFGHGADGHVIQQTHPLKPTLELTALDIGVVLFFNSLLSSHTHKYPHYIYFFEISHLHQCILN